MPLNAAELFEQLSNHPGKFLKEHPLSIAIGKNLASGVHDVYLSEKPIGDPGQLIVSDKDPEDMNAAFVAPFKHKFKAHVVPMITLPNWDETKQGKSVPLLSGSLLGPGGPPIMVTGQLSGCAICMLDVKNGAGLLCAHIQPTGNHGLQLQQALMADKTGARFAAAAQAPVIVYGKQNYRDSRSVVLAVRKNGKWQVYTQLRNASGDVTAAQRIYPP